MEPCHTNSRTRKPVFLTEKCPAGTSRSASEGNEIGTQQKPDAGGDVQLSYFFFSGTGSAFGPVGNTGIKCSGIGVPLSRKAFSAVRLSWKGCFLSTASQLNREKKQLVVDGTDLAYRMAKKYKLKLAWGTDLMFDPKWAENQSKDILKLEKWFSPLLGNADSVSASIPRSLDSLSPFLIRLEPTSGAGSNCKPLRPTPMSASASTVPPIGSDRPSQLPSTNQTVPQSSGDTPGSIDTHTSFSTRPPSPTPPFAPPCRSLPSRKPPRSTRSDSRSTLGPYATASLPLPSPWGFGGHCRLEKRRRCLRFYEVGNLARLSNLPEVVWSICQFR